MYEYFTLALIGLAVWFWFDVSSKREIAINRSKNLASQFNLQLLDESVHCHELKFVRTSSNWPAIKRVYYFSVSANNQNRLDCQLTLIGSSLTHWYVPPYPHQ
tara:strand:+ start:61 stop:369 length:309 start_codon:yes stop_codon:yes gene_type:complete